jgi:hypothetical protein
MSSYPELDFVPNGQSERSKSTETICLFISGRFYATTSIVVAIKPKLTSPWNASQRLLVLVVQRFHGPGAEQARFAGPLPMRLGTSQDRNAIALNITLRERLRRARGCVGDVSLLAKCWLETIGEARGLLKHSADPMGSHPVMSLLRGRCVTATMRMASRYTSSI